MLLLISDLHLQESRPDITAALTWFLRMKTAQARQLYILGDLFEVWIGDDAPSALADRVAADLRSLADEGKEIFLMHGNRDFLIGDDFAERCGATLVEEPVLLNIADKSVALLHGDTLCTDDTDYQKFRQLVRDSQWQADFLSQTIKQRQQFARQAREQSQTATASASAQIMDVTDSAVKELFSKLQVDYVVHGHTHRPAIHRIDSDSTGDNRQRVVLGDWDKFGWYSRIDEDGAVSLHKFDLPAGR